MLKNIKKLQSGVALGSFLALASLAGVARPATAGQVVTSPEGKMAKPIIEPEEPSRWSGDAGFTFVSQYISRGYVLENQGVIFQPYLDLYLKLYEGKGFINKVSLSLGLWASVNSHKTDASPGSTVPDWYEFDYYPGLSVVFAEQWTFSLTYIGFNYPNGGFGTQGNLSMKLALDDSKWLGKFALHPYASAQWYFQNPDGGWYYELGIAPSYTAGPVTLALPVILGLGNYRFYPSDNFGYVSVGATASVPLTFIPKSYGTWTLSGGVTWYYLGAALKDYNVPNQRSSSDTEWVFSGGMVVAF